MPRSLLQLYYFFAATFPLYAVSFLRINTTIGHIQIPSLFLIGILIFHIVSDFKNNKGVLFTSQFLRYKYIFLLLLSFYLLHVASLFLHPETLRAPKEITKLGIGVISFIGLAIYFPRDKNFFYRFMVILISATCLLTVYLILIYIIKHYSCFLSTVLETRQRSGRTSLAWMLNLILPFCAIFLIKPKILNRIFAIITSTVLSAAIVYTLSRGAWLSFICGLFITLAIAFIIKKPHTIKTVFRSHALLIISLLIGLTILLPSIRTECLAARVLSIKNGIALFVSKTTSANLQSETKLKTDIQNYKEEYGMYAEYSPNSFTGRAKVLLKAHKGFLDKPVFGHGLTYFRKNFGTLPHSDYFKILYEFGLVGIGLFIGFLATIFALLVKTTSKDNGSYNYISVAALFSFLIFCISLITIDTYTSTHFWIVLALIMSANNQKLPL